MALSVREFLKATKELLIAYGVAKGTWGSEHGGFCTVGGAREVRDRFCRIGLDSEHVNHVYMTSLEKLKGCAPAETLAQHPEADATELLILNNDQPKTDQGDVLQMFDCAMICANDSPEVTKTRIATKISEWKAEAAAKQEKPKDNEDEDEDEEVYA